MISKIYDREQLWIVAYDHFREQRPELINAEICEATGLKSSYLSGCLGKNRSRPISMDARERISAFFETSVPEMEKLGLNLSTVDASVPSRIGDPWDAEALETMDPLELLQAVNGYAADVAGLYAEYARRISTRVSNLANDRNRLWDKCEELNKRLSQPGHRRPRLKALLKHTNECIMFFDESENLVDAANLLRDDLNSLAEVLEYSEKEFTDTDAARQAITEAYADFQARDYTQTHNASGKTYRYHVEPVFHETAFIGIMILVREIEL